MEPKPNINKLFAAFDRFRNTIMIANRGSNMTKLAEAFVEARQQLREDLAALSIYPDQFDWSE